MDIQDFFKISTAGLDTYQRNIYADTVRWVHRNKLKYNLFNNLTSSIQKRINKAIPDKVHDAITTTMRETIKALLVGTRFISPAPRHYLHIQIAEKDIRSNITNHKITAAAEGGLTGAGGFLWSLADFPLLLTIKIKLLQDIASYYGYDGNTVSEKIFLLLILQTAFSSDDVKKETIDKVLNFEHVREELPDSINAIDWLTLQQQYRDYIDVAKLLQMLPLIGAVVGTVTNYRLLQKLGLTAMHCYRIRYFQTRYQKQDSN